MKEIPINGEKFVGTSLYNLPQAEIEGFDSLAELALDLRWSWNHAADELWRRLDPALWELTQNPRVGSIANFSNCKGNIRWFSYGFRG